jgi:hypothetical protein
MGARRRVPAILGAAGLRDSDGAPSTEATKRSVQRNRAQSQQLELGKARGIGDGLSLSPKAKVRGPNPLGRAKFQFLDLDAKLDWFLRKCREIIGQFAALLALGNL